MEPTGTNNPRSLSGLTVGLSQVQTVPDIFFAPPTLHIVHGEGGIGWAEETVCSCGQRRPQPQLPADHVAVVKVPLVVTDRVAVHIDVAQPGVIGEALQNQSWHTWSRYFWGQLLFFRNFWTSTDLS